MEILKNNDERYPKRLKELRAMPKVLYAKGNLDLLNKTSVAIVGTRNIDNYGIDQTRRFASFLAQKDICIVSGLARGVDTIAHEYSKDKLGKTIAVIASGFKHIYPEENKKLADEIVQNGGLILSEWPEDEEVDMQRFPRRNRIISGLSNGVLVVEALYRSGSSITAHYAIKQKREVFCIPGNLDKTRSWGTNKLIEEGAALVMSPQDILDILEYDGFYAENNLKVAPEHQDVYKYIGTLPISANQISQISKKKIAEIEEALLMLELDGFIEQTAGGKYRIKEKGEM